VRQPTEKGQHRHEGIRQKLIRSKNIKTHGAHAMGFLLPVNLDDLHRTQDRQNPGKSCQSQQWPHSQRVDGEIALLNATFETSHWKPEP
jgi:hypothetical protein